MAFVQASGGKYPPVTFLVTAWDLLLQRNIIASQAACEYIVFSIAQRIDHKTQMTSGAESWCVQSNCWYSCLQ
jgi:hypothetical protein